MRTCDIAKKLNLSSLEVSTFAGNCKLYKSHEAFYSPRKLCQEKQNLIFKNYATGDLNELCKKTNQSLHALQAWANKNGLKRQVNNNRKGMNSIQCFPF